MSSGIAAAAIPDDKKMGFIVSNVIVHTWQKVTCRRKISMSLSSSANGPWNWHFFAVSGLNSCVWKGKKCLFNVQFLLKYKMIFTVTSRAKCRHCRTSGHRKSTAPTTTESIWSSARTDLMETAPTWGWLGHTSRWLYQMRDWIFSCRREIRYVAVRQK